MPSSPARAASPRPGRATGSRPPDVAAVRRAADRHRRTAARRSRRRASPGRAAGCAGAPKSGTASRRRSGRGRRRGRPASRRERGQQLAARLAQADEADAGRAARPDEPRLERRRRRRSPSAPTGAADPRGEEERRAARCAPKWRPTKMTGRPAANASSTTSGVSMTSRASTSPGRERRRPGDLEVVARAVAEGGADQPLEGPWDRWRRRGPPGCPDPMAASAWQTRRRLRRAWAARAGRERGTRGRRPASASRVSGPSGRWQASHEAAMSDRAADRLNVTATSPVAAAPSTVAMSSSGGATPGRPGSGRPACISSARRSRSAASAAVAGQIGLKLYHCSGAAAIVRGERVGDRLGRPLELGRVRRGDLDRRRPGDREPAVRPAVDGDRQDPRAGLGGQRRGTGRQGRPGVEQPHRDAVAAVAPVDQQGQHLAAPQDPVDRPQVAPRDDLDAPALALAAQELEQLGERGVVGDHADREARAGDGRRDGLVVADVPDREDDAPPRGRRPPVADDLARRRGPAPGRPTSLGRPRRQAHQLDEVAPVLRGTRAAPAGGPAGRTGGRPRTWPKFRFDQRRFVGHSEVRGLEQAADDRSRQAGRHAGTGATRSSDSPPSTRRSTTRGLAPPRRCGASSRCRRARGGRSAWAVGHLAAAVATLALVPASALERPLGRRLGADAASRRPRPG